MVLGLERQGRQERGLGPAVGAVGKGKRTAALCRRRGGAAAVEGPQGTRVCACKQPGWHRIVAARLQEFVGRRRPGAGSVRRQGRQEIRLAGRFTEPCHLRPGQADRAVGIRSGIVVHRLGELCREKRPAHGGGEGGRGVRARRFGRRAVVQPGQPGEPRSQDRRAEGAWRLKARVPPSSLEGRVWWVAFVWTVCFARAVMSAWWRSGGAMSASRIRSWSGGSSISEIFRRSSPWMVRTSTAR